MKLINYVLTTVGVVVGIIVIILAWFLVSLSPTRSQTAPETFTVQSGESVEKVLQNLQSAHLIRSQLAMRLVTTKVRAGSYRFKTDMSGWRIASALETGKLSAASITIPEGYTESQIAVLLEKKRIVSQYSFYQAIKKLDRSKYSFLKGVKGDKLEGFLFPDTYFFAEDTPAEAVLERLLDNFAKRTASLQWPHSYSIYQTVILASLVEREAKTDEDMRLVASVMENRIKEGMRLDIDATVRYGLNQWDKPLTAQDLQSNSPYNTRKFAGLPPTPIANPGLRAMKAVIEAPSTDYLYYLTGTDGKTYFAKTLAEHALNKQKYLK